MKPARFGLNVPLVVAPDRSKHRMTSNAPLSAVGGTRGVGLVKRWRTGSFAGAWREHRLWYGIVALHTALAISLDWLGVADVWRQGMWDLAFPLLLLAYLIASAPIVLASEIRRGPEGAVWRAFNAPRLMRAILAVLGVVVMFKTHDGWKAAISDAGFAWDPMLARVDAALHLGRHPYEWLAPAFAVPGTIATIDWLYEPVWFAVLFGMLTWQAWSADVIMRSRFFLALALIIVIAGSFLAHLFASAGPTFYGQIVPGPDPYAPLMGVLEAADRSDGLAAFRIRGDLWYSYSTNARASWLNISAMPSLHVAFAVLFALRGWATSRSLGCLLAVYAGMTLIGSVQLAWHYAIDGYVAAVVAVIAWFLAGRLTRGERLGSAHGPLVPTDPAR